MVGVLVAAMVLAAPDTGRVAPVAGRVGSAPEAVVAAEAVDRAAPAGEAASPAARNLAARPVPRFGATESWPALLTAGGAGDAAAATALPDVGPAPADTPVTKRKRPVLVDYSDAYYTRLKIHKIASYVMLPLFGLEYYSGTQLYNKGLAAPRWVRDVHRPVATAMAGLFLVNTVTGVWNLWEGRKDPEARGWRTAHGVLMLLADAGFVATGLTAPHEHRESGVFGPGSPLEGEGSHGNPRLHKEIAISSMGVAMVSWIMMLPPFRRD